MKPAEVRPPRTGLTLQNLKTTTTVTVADLPSHFDSATFPGAYCVPGYNMNKTDPTLSPSTFGGRQAGVQQSRENTQHTGQREDSDGGSQRAGAAPARGEVGNGTEHLRAFHSTHPKMQTLDGAPQCFRPG